MRGNQVCKNERSYPLSMGDTEEFKKIIFLLYQFGRQSLFAFEYVKILPKNCWFNKGFKSITVFACIYQVVLELADVSGKY